MTQTFILMAKTSPFSKSNCCWIFKKCKATRWKTGWHLFNLNLWPEETQEPCAFKRNWFLIDFFGQIVAETGDLEIDLILFVEILYIKKLYEGERMLDLFLSQIWKMTENLRCSLNGNLPDQNLGTELTKNYYVWRIFIIKRIFLLIQIFTVPYFLLQAVALKLLK